MSVKRRRVIRSYAGFTLAAAQYTIEPLTKSAHEAALEFYDKRVTSRTGALRKSIKYNVRGNVGAIIASAPHAHLIEYGVPSRNVKPRPFMRAGKNKALREIKKVWKEGFNKAYGEQST